MRTTQSRAVFVIKLRARTISRARVPYLYSYRVDERINLKSKFDLNRPPRGRARAAFGPRSYGSDTSLMRETKTRSTLVEETRSTQDPNLNALEENIARRGNNAYYYAHGHRNNAPAWDGDPSPMKLENAEPAAREQTQTAV